MADLARFDWRTRGSSKFGSLPLAIYVQYAFIDALAELANEWCALGFLLREKLHLKTRLLVCTAFRRDDVIASL